MCGRVAQGRPSSEFARIFGAVDLADDPGGRYNVAPTDPISVVVERGGRRVLTNYRWGLVPPWASSPAEAGGRMINARAETIASSPAFRSSLESRRCLVAADGFYEWRRLPDGGRQPFFIRRSDGAPLAFAGLWSSWRVPGIDAPPLRSATIVTTKPNALVARLRDRMPVVLAPAVWDPWLDPSLHGAGEVIGLLQPRPPDEFVAYPVSRAVNSVRNNGMHLVAPMGPALA